MSIERKPFGTLASGEECSLYILKSDDIVVSLTDYGATLVSILLPDGRGGRDDILLGSSTLTGYTLKHPFFGVTVGRYANRIGGSKFSLGGHDYQLAANDGVNHLHGGLKGFNTYVWSAEGSDGPDGTKLRFTRTSLDGEEGYPGTLDAQVLFTLSNQGLSIRYEARTNAETVVNLTNHAYFNLKGEGSGTILDHELSLDCSTYLPVGPTLIPTGEPMSVEGGSFDFRIAKRLGRDIEATGGGYDHCFVVDRQSPGLLEFGRVKEPKTGRRMTVSTTLPGVQLYTGNYLSAEPGKRGSVYGKHSGFCLETQLFPDSPNKPTYPTSRLLPGETWAHETIYRFYP